MELRIIYADHDRVELGELMDYEIDVDTADKKDFEIKMKKGVDAVPLKAGYYWFIEGMEYGGVIDRVESDTSTRELKFIGRNARGIMASKLLKPEAGEDKVVLSGRFDECLNYMYQNTEIVDLFVAEKTEEFEVEDFEIEPFTNLYDASIKLLNSQNAVMKIKYSSKDRKWHINVELVTDFSDTVNYCIDNSLNFRCRVDSNAVNHLVVTDVDDENIRRTIHLFTDENGGIRPYKKVDEPKKDSDYILDESEKVIIGLDEWEEVVETNSSSVVENYILLKSKPNDWREVYKNYYYMDEEGDFVKYESHKEKVYQALTSQPNDWAKNYANYYIKTGSSHNSVDGVESSYYRQLKKRPKNWKRGYRDYFYRWHNGVEYLFDAVSAVIKEYYRKQTRKPTDWRGNYSNYFNIKKKKFVRVEGTGKNKKGIPKWRKNKYYTQYQRNLTPKFKKGFHFEEVTTVKAPTFTSGKYYKHVETVIIPPYKSKGTYVKVLDHYASLVETGLERLEDLRATEKQEVELSGLDVDIGDVVGGEDELLGVLICEKVTNTIVKLNHQGLKIEYVVGGEDK